MSQRLAFIRPCLAVPGKAPPKGDQWVHEAKWDGFRVQVVKDGSDVRLYSKNGAEWTKKLPAMVEAFRGLQARSAILDGELCHSGASGPPDFRAPRVHGPALARSKAPSIPRLACVKRCVFLGIAAPVQKTHG